MAPKSIVKYDIFRNYRKDNEDPSVWKPSPQPPFPEVRVKEGAPTMQLTSGETVKRLRGFASITRDEGLISSANDRIQLVTNVNKCMAAHNYVGAELLLGRKVTTAEIQAQLVKDFSVQPLTDVEKAKREIRRDTLKAKILADTKSQEEMAKRYKDLRLAAEEAKKKLAAGFTMDEVLRQLKGESDLVNEGIDFARLLDLAMGKDEAIDSLLRDDPPKYDVDSATNDELETIAESVADRGSTVEQGLSLLDDTRSLPETMINPDDTRSLPETIVRPAATTVVDSESKADDDFGSDDEGDEEADDESIVTVEEPKKKYNDNALKIYYHPDQSYTTIPQLRSICAQMIIDEADDDSGVKDINVLHKLLGYKSAKKADLVAMVKNTLEYIEKRNREPAPEPLVGHGLFPTGSKIRNKHHFVKFGRYALNAKKLKDQDMFSIVHPMGGKAGIPNSILSAALKAVVERHLSGEPIDDKDLTSQEKEWKDYIWLQTHLSRKQPKLTVYKPKLTLKKDILDRIKVLVGEIAAGNDSDLVPTELASLVKKAHMKLWLTPAQIIKYKQFLEDLE